MEVLKYYQLICLVRISIKQKSDKVQQRYLLKNDSTLGNNIYSK